MKSVSTTLVACAVMLGSCVALRPRLAAEEPRNDSNALREEIVKTLQGVLDKQTNTLQRLQTAKVLLKFDPENKTAVEVLLSEGYYGAKLSNGVPKDKAKEQAEKFIHEAIRTASPALVLTLIEILKREEDEYRREEIVEMLSHIEVSAFNK